MRPGSSKDAVTREIDDSLRGFGIVSRNPAIAFSPQAASSPDHVPGRGTPRKTPTDPQRDSVSASILQATLRFLG